MKLLRTIFYSLFMLLPEAIRLTIVRKKARVDIERVKKFHFKIADTQDEMIQSFTILYDSYCEAELMDHNRTGLRITKYHLLPTSVMIVAKYGDEVVGTVTHVMDSKFGLPIESQVNITELRKNSDRIAEISALAIKKKYRKNLSLLFGLTRFLYHYGRSTGTQHWVICVRDIAGDYYKAIFFFKKFKRISDSPFKYSFVKGKDSVSLYCDLMELPELFKRYYIKFPKPNLYDFYWESYKPEQHETHTKYYPPMFPAKNANMIDFFFNKCEHILGSLNNAEKEEFVTNYCYNNIEAIKLLNEFKHLKDLSGVSRYFSSPVFLKAHIYQKDEKNFSFRHVSVHHVSRSGLTFMSTSELKIGMIHTLAIHVGPVYRLNIDIKIKEVLPGSNYRCELIDRHDSHWREYLDYITMPDKFSRKIYRKA